MLSTQQYKGWEIQQMALVIGCGLMAEKRELHIFPSEQFFLEFGLKVKKTRSIGPQKVLSSLWCHWPHRDPLANCLCSDQGVLTLTLILFLKGDQYGWPPCPYWLGISCFKTSWEFFFHFQANLALIGKDKEVNRTETFPFRIKVSVPWSDGPRLKNTTSEFLYGTNDAWLD